jgi:calcium-dependent protein kinase
MDMSLFADQFMIDSLKTEIAVMKTLKSPYVVQMVDVFGDAQQTVIIIELCNGGDLRGYIDKQGGMLEEVDAVKVLSDLMKGF